MTSRGQFTRTAYDHRWVRVELADVEASRGDRFEHRVVRLGAVAIALLTRPAGEVLTSSLYRFPVRQ